MLLQQNKPHTLEKLNQQMVHCNQCKRLRSHCLTITKKKKKSYINETYWGRPVPSFGDPAAKLLIVGLAPAAHGANRTGRMFTGDRSGLWLYRALHKFGFANQAQSESLNDGLKLHQTYITAAVHCAPPDNKPNQEEFEHCLQFLAHEWALLSEVRVVLVLGKIALDQTWKILKQNLEKPQKKPMFKHGALYSFGSKKLLCSYHPSQQNTFTGRLTEPMFDEIFKTASSYIF